MKTCLHANWLALGLLVVLLIVACPDQAYGRGEAATQEPRFYGVMGIGLAVLFTAVRKRRRQVK